MQNGTLIGVKDASSICSTAPCSLTISIDTSSDDPFSPYYDVYARDILSNLTYNRTTHVVTYSFIDLTGLAEYFRLEVKRPTYNETQTTICNTQSFSTAGSITCNLTGYGGEFIATGLISRSPEKTDLVISFITSEEIINDLGLDGVFLIMVLIIVIVCAGAIVTKGSPSGIMFFLGIGILLMKLASIWPFTWPTTIAIEFLIGFIIWKVKQ